MINRDGRKCPRNFSIEVPVLKVGGSLQRGSDCKPTFKMEYYVLSCFIIAHQEMWKSVYEGKRSEKSAASREASDEPSVIVERICVP